MAWWARLGMAWSCMAWTRMGMAWSRMGMAPAHMVGRRASLCVWRLQLLALGSDRLGLGQSLGLLSTSGGVVKCRRSPIEVL